MRQIAVAFLAVILAGCSTSVSIKNADGTTMQGSLINGSMSYSSGAACTPAQPNPATAIPAAAPAVLTSKMVCDANGANCRAALVQADSAPQCYTQVATVRGTDITSYFGWVFAALAAASVAVASGT